MQSTVYMVDYDIYMCLKRICNVDLCIQGL